MTEMNCYHPDRGRCWKMEPIPGGEVRRVRLCSCGVTRDARLGATSVKWFDDQAKRELQNAGHLALVDA